MLIYTPLLRGAGEEFVDIKKELYAVCFLEILESKQSSPIQRKKNSGRRAGLEKITENAARAI
jgi:hypothetical protein